MYALLTHRGTTAWQRGTLMSSGKTHCHPANNSHVVKKGTNNEIYYSPHVVPCLLLEKEWEKRMACSVPGWEMVGLWLVMSVAGGEESFTLQWERQPITYRCKRGLSWKGSSQKRELLSISFTCISAIGWAWEAMSLIWLWLLLCVIVLIKG